MEYKYLLQDMQQLLKDSNYRQLDLPYLTVNKEEDKKRFNRIKADLEAQNILASPIEIRKVLKTEKEDSINRGDKSIMDKYIVLHTQATVDKWFKKKKFTINVYPEYAEIARLCMRYSLHHVQRYILYLKRDFELYFDREKYNAELAAPEDDQAALPDEKADEFFESTYQDYRIADYSEAELSDLLSCFDFDYEKMLEAETACYGLIINEAYEKEFKYYIQKIRESRVFVHSIKSPEVSSFIDELMTELDLLADETVENRQRYEDLFVAVCELHDRYERLFVYRSELEMEEAVLKYHYHTTAGYLEFEYESLKWENDYLEAAVSLKQKQPALTEAEIKNILAKDGKEYIYKNIIKNVYYGSCFPPDTTSEETIRQAKTVFRDLAKKLHTDTRPEWQHNPEIEGMWDELQEAYNARQMVFDLDTLLDIQERLAAFEAEHELPAVPPEPGIEARIRQYAEKEERFKQSCERLLLDIKVLENSIFLTMIKQLLEDPEKLEEFKSVLQNKLTEEKNKSSQLHDKYRALINPLGINSLSDTI